MKNENIKNSYYLFSEENTEVKNKKVRVMTRFYFKDPDSNKPTSVDCYVDFAPSYGVKLADLELVGREEDGTPNHFVNVCGMQRLHNGAIWQQYEKHERLLEAVYDLAKESIGEEKAKAILEKHEVKRLN